MLHVVEVIDALLELGEENGFASEEGFGGELFEWLVLDAFEEEVFLDVDEQVVEVVGEVVPEEFLEEERFHSGEDVDAALLAVERLELLVVTRLVSLFLHPRSGNKVGKII